MKSKVFGLTNLILYAKGWYKKSDNLIEDLKKILELDNYSPFSKNDVYSIILNHFSRWDHNSTELITILSGIHPDNCWKIGYNYKENNLEYDLVEASIYYVLSSVRFIDDNYWVVKTPKYSKFPKNPTISTKQVVKIFN